MMSTSVLTDQVDGGSRPIGNMMGGLAGIGGFGIGAIGNLMGGFGQNHQNFLQGTNANNVWNMLGGGGLSSMLNNKSNGQNLASQMSGGQSVLNSPQFQTVASQMSGGQSILTKENSMDLLNGLKQGNMVPALNSIGNGATTSSGTAGFTGAQINPQAMSSQAVFGNIQNFQDGGRVANRKPEKQFKILHYMIGGRVK